MKKNNKGFTLIELLAVIVILGLLMAIAIPSITRYITESRRKTVVSSINSYVSSVLTQVNDGEYKFSDSTKIYAVPIECIPLEKGGTNPFGNWLQANEAYWAYVLVQYDNENYNYTYGFTFKDDAGYGMYPTSHANIDESGNQIKTGYDDLNKPTTGLAIEFVTEDKWTGFNVTTSTDLVVLEAESEGVPGNSETTCTLCQKGDNYTQVEAEKNNSGGEVKSNCGDINDDGVVNEDDITLFRQYIVGDYPLSDKTLSLIEERGDTNGDNTIDIRDITTIRMHIVGGYGYDELKCPVNESSTT